MSTVSTSVTNIVNFSKAVGAKVLVLAKAGDVVSLTTLIPDLQAVVNGYANVVNSFLSIPKPPKNGLQALGWLFANIGTLSTLFGQPFADADAGAKTFAVKYGIKY